MKKLLLIPLLIVGWGSSPIEYSSNDESSQNILTQYKNPDGCWNLLEKTRQHWNESDWDEALILIPKQPKSELPYNPIDD